MSSPGPLSLSSPVDRQLATADAVGSIMVWDINKGTVALEFATKVAKLTKPVAALVRWWCHATPMFGTKHAMLVLLSSKTARPPPPL